MKTLIIQWSHNIYVDQSEFQFAVYHLDLFPTSPKTLHKVNKSAADVIYFNATTLYFESFTEDDFRKNGYSKDGKFNQPQVVLALMAIKAGLPVGYKVYSGDTLDGHALIPTFKEVKRDYTSDKVICVADSGMFDRENLKEIEMMGNGIRYIVGARIKNMNKEFTRKVTNMDNYTAIDDNLLIASFDY